MKLKIFSGSVTLMLAVACAGCGDDDAVKQIHVDAVSQYAIVAEKAYSDSVDTARALQTAVDAFVAAPSDATLQAAKDAWLASREPYLQTEVYRFYEGPIDNETDGPEGLLNAWPMDENYVAYTLGSDGSILVNYQILQVVVNVCIMNVFVEIFGNSS